ncbi:penicillin-binding transpeptidase domain-containing protein [Flavobacteriales bacterium]|nr:penicillin-binding transpeptidase domain-containing protein [Flavobacteriales bacterium]
MKNKVNYRVISLYVFMCVIAFVVMSKILVIQRLNQEISSVNLPKLFKIQASRGNIFSDDGSLLAISMPLYNVFLDLSVIDEQLFNKEVNSLSQSLSLLFKDKSTEQYEQYLRDSRSKKNNKYVRLRNKVSHNELIMLKSFSILKLGKNRGGLIAEERPNRENPFGLLARRTIGVLRESNPIGLERAYNKTLSGTDGLQLKQRVGKSFWRNEESELNSLPKSGNDIVTTINIDMQDVTEKALKSALRFHDADWGTAIIMEVESGYIKAIANLKYEDGDFDEHYNHAIAEHSEPGSTFKLASILAGLEDGFYSLLDSVDTEDGTHQFYDKTMRDSKKGGYGKISIGDAFVQSSNVGISKVINRSYKDKPQDFIDRIYKMGLCTPLDLELPYPNSLLIKQPGSPGWSGVTLPWMSIGYSLRLTPLHILTFYNAIANNGVMVSPLFTTQILKDGKKVSEHSKKVINPAICSKSSIVQIMPYLIDVVEKGTAKSIRTRKYKIAGKTGTTLLAYGEKSEDNIKQYQTSFVGFFPAENPKYSCMVVVNNPKENGFYGGNVSAPIFKEISDKVFAADISIHNSILIAEQIKDSPNLTQGKTEDMSKLLDNLSLEYEKTKSNWMVPSYSSMKISLERRSIEKDFEEGLMPNLFGMNLLDAVYLLENAGLKVEIKGKGHVVNQSIKKGDRFLADQKISLIASI